MSNDETFSTNLLDEIEPPKGGILSRTLFTSSQIKLVLFAFDTGQELSEHTATTAATVQILSGEGRLTLGSESIAARPGTWVHMPPRLPHSLLAETPLVMLLTLLK